MSKMQACEISKGWESEASEAASMSSKDNGEVGSLTSMVSKLALPSEGDKDNSERVFLMIKRLLK